MTVEFSASTYTYLWKADLPTALTEISAAGYASAEVMAAPPHVELWRDPGPAIADVREVCARAGTRISSVVPAGLDVNLASPDGAMRDWSIKHYIAVGRFASAVGADCLVVHPGRRHPFKPAPYEAARDWVIEGVTQIVEAMEVEGLRSVFENSPSTILDTAEECVDIVRSVGQERMGICYDVANGFSVEDPCHGLRTVGNLLELVHLSDSTVARWLHDPIGTGEVDFVAAASTIEELAYAGTVVVETIHDRDVAAGLEADRLALRAAGWHDPDGDGR